MGYASRTSLPRSSLREGLTRNVFRVREVSPGAGKGVAGLRPRYYINMAPSSLVLACRLAHLLITPLGFSFTYSKPTASHTNSAIALTWQTLSRRHQLQLRAQHLSTTFARPIVSNTIDIARAYIRQLVGVVQKQKGDHSGGQGVSTSLSAMKT